MTEAAMANTSVAETRMTITAPMTKPEMADADPVAPVPAVVWVRVAAIIRGSVMVSVATLPIRVTASAAGFVGRPIRPAVALDVISHDVVRIAERFVTSHDVVNEGTYRVISIAAHIAIGSKLSVIPVSAPSVRVVVERLAAYDTNEIPGPRRTADRESIAGTAGGHEILVAGTD